MTVRSSLNFYTRNERDEIANLAFLAARPNRQISNRAPHLYLAEIANEHPERLVAQCIPMNRDLWKMEKYRDFISERRKLLANSVNALLNITSK